MSNYRPRIWIKSSFSSDTANCVEVANVDGEIFMRDSKLGDKSPLLRFGITSWWRFIDPIVYKKDPRQVTREPDGSVVVATSERSARLRYTAGEWLAFEYGVRQGELDPEKLSEGVSAGSGSVAGSGEAAAGTDVSWGGAVPVAAEQPLDDELDTLIWPPPVNPLRIAARHDHDPTSNPASRVLPEAAHLDAAGTGVPPDPVPVAQPRPIISDEAVEVLARRLHRSRYYGPMVDDVRDDHRWNELLIDREREEYRDAARAHLAAVYPLLRERWEAWSADDEEAWARAVAPLVRTDGAT
jgi:hypothetical protein